MDIGFSGSYPKEDVVFLLKDISNISLEMDNKSRENMIQKGIHYSEMLPIEYEVSNEYMNLYYSQLERVKEELAYYVAVLSEKIIKKRGQDIVLASLARAGTPIGILVKRYIKYKYNKDIPHYSISIIRDKGIDENAINYIINKHDTTKIQFIDGWTGKGTISRVLIQSCNEFECKYGIKLDNSLGVIADPAGYSNLYGTRKDFLIPSACLNSTISGLVSRTVLRDDIIKENDFHGVKYYSELHEKDQSNKYIDTISQYFSIVEKYASEHVCTCEEDIITNDGDKDLGILREKYKVNDMNFIKPGLGETLRVLLRRVPDVILVRDKKDIEIEPILRLAKEKSVKVKVDKLIAYKACGIIKSVKDV